MVQQVEAYQGTANVVKRTGRPPPLVAMCIKETSQPLLMDSPESRGRSIQPALLVHTIKKITWSTIMYGPSKRVWNGRIMS